MLAFCETNSEDDIGFVITESTHTSIIVTYLCREEFEHEELSDKPTDDNGIVYQSTFI